jgi:hypothetical protein
MVRLRTKCVMPSLTSYLTERQTWLSADRPFIALCCRKKIELNVSCLFSKIAQNSIQGIWVDGASVLPIQVFAEPMYGNYNIQQVGMASKLEKPQSG